MMASWNDVTEGSQLGKCPVCLCSLAKKKLMRHTYDCYKSKKPQMDELGVIQCPFDQFHILPITFLNHHLEGNCQEVLNLLRKFYQKKDQFGNFAGAPADYDPGIPEKYLNKHNRNLIYLLNEDLYGDFIRDFDKKNEQNSSKEVPEEPEPSAPENCGVNGDDDVINI